MREYSNINDSRVLTLIPFYFRFKKSVTLTQIWKAHNRLVNEFIYCNLNPGQKKTLIPLLGKPLKNGIFHS